MTSALVSLSGGMDSATVLALAHRNHGGSVEAVGFTYGSKHNLYENAAANALAKHYEVPFTLIDLSTIMRGFRSALLKSGEAIPEGHYEADTMRATVVPARNLIFASILTGIAASKNIGTIMLGVHAGDHHIYPDCRPSFIASLQDTVNEAVEERISITAPFLHVKKEDILKVGFVLNTPYHLTRTCYKDQPIACGMCGSCQERLEAFANLGKEDPIAYETRAILPKF